MANENAKVVAERHSSVKLTLDTYQHVHPSMQETATEKLASLLAIGGSFVGAETLLFPQR